MAHEVGEPVLFELSSTDVSTAAAITIRNAGTNTTRTLAADERLIVQGYTAAAVAAATLFDDADADGAVDANERLAIIGAGTSFINFAGTGGGVSGGLGRTPKILGAASALSIAGWGAIVKG